MTRDEAEAKIWTAVGGWLHATGVDELVSGFKALSEADQDRLEDARDRVLQMINRHDRLADERAYRRKRGKAVARRPSMSR